LASWLVLLFLLYYRCLRLLYFLFDGRNYGTAVGCAFFSFMSLFGGSLLYFVYIFSGAKRKKKSTEAGLLVLVTYCSSLYNTRTSRTYNIVLYGNFSLINVSNFWRGKLVPGYVSMLCEYLKFICMNEGVHGKLANCPKPKIHEIKISEYRLSHWTSTIRCIRYRTMQ